MSHYCSWFLPTPSAQLTMCDATRSAGTPPCPCMQQGRAADKHSRQFAPQRDSTLRLQGAVSGSAMPLRRNKPQRPRALSNSTSPHAAKGVAYLPSRIASCLQFCAHFFLGAGFAGAGLAPFLLSGTPSTRDILPSTCGLGMALPLSYSCITLGFSFTACTRARAELHLRSLVLPTAILPARS